MTQPTPSCGGTKKIYHQGHYACSEIGAPFCSDKGKPCPGCKDCSEPKAAILMPDGNGEPRDVKEAPFNPKDGRCGEGKCELCKGIICKENPAEYQVHYHWDGYEKYCHPNSTLHGAKGEHGYYYGHPKQN